MPDRNIHIEKAAWAIPSNFKCRKHDFADYLVSNAAYDQMQRMGRLYWALCKDEVVGYMMLAADSLGKEKQAKLGIDSYGNIPALLISLLAVDKRHEGHGIGSFMVQYAQNIASSMATSVGCRVVLVNSEPDTVEFYKKLKFVEIGHDGDYVTMYLMVGHNVFHDFAGVSHCLTD